MKIRATNVINAVEAICMVPGCFPSSLFTLSDCSHSPYVIRISIAAINQKNMTFPIIFDSCGIM